MIVGSITSTDRGKVLSSHPPEISTSKLYVPATVAENVGLAIALFDNVPVEGFPGNSVQEKLTPPVAFKVVEFPEQISVSKVETEGMLGSTVIITSSVIVQPFESDNVTVYVVVDKGVAVGFANEGSFKGPPIQL